MEKKIIMPTLLSLIVHKRLIHKNYSTHFVDINNVADVEQTV